MEKELAHQIAVKIKQSMQDIGEVVSLTLTPAERARLARPIGQIFAIASDELYVYLVSQNPNLHDLLFPGLPKD